MTLVSYYWKMTMGYFVVLVCMIGGFYLVFSTHKGMEKAKKEGDVDGVQRNTERIMIGIFLLFVGPFFGLFLVIFIDRTD